MTDCIELPITPSGSFFYVTPWTPAAGKSFVYKNTILADTLVLFRLTSTEDFTDNYYEIGKRW